MKIRETIRRIGAYKPPLDGRNPDQYLLMDFNEAPYPPPQHVIDSLHEFIHSNRVQVYPSYGPFMKMLAGYLGLKEEQLIITNGSDQAIEIILRAFLGEGDEMILARPGFGMFFQVADTLGARVISPFYHADMSFPMAEIRASISDQTRLLVLINPNNPTGTAIPIPDIEGLLRDFVDLAILVDEAYVEFTGDSCLHLLEKYPNLIVIRTFSKAFAMPSLRLGYAAADPQFIEQLYKIRGPYDINMLAITAAQAQIQRPQEWQTMVDHIMLVSKPTLLNFFQQAKVRFFPSAAHFLLVEPQDVKSAIQFLKDKGILVRPMQPPISHLFRMNVGTLSMTQRFIEIYQEYLQKHEKVIDNPTLKSI